MLTHVHNSVPVGQAIRGASVDDHHRVDAPEGPAGRPLRVMFLVTSLPFGGAETLLVNLVRRLDRKRFLPEVGCMKERGPLGDVLSQEIPVFESLLKHKYDISVIRRLARLLRERQIDVVITVGDGDKSFWGRLAARWSRVPVVLYASHMQGWPGRIEWSNRQLTFLTDGYIAVATVHGNYLHEAEGFPREKIFVVHNGVDVQRFRPLPPADALRRSLGVPPGAPVVTVVAALRPQKNHEGLLRVAQRVLAKLPETHFLLVGDGEQRAKIVELTAALGLQSSVHFLGSRTDVPELLALSDVKVLTSHSEANPVSLLEAMACEKPVVATAVGSVPETVTNGINGYLTPAGDEEASAQAILALLEDPELRRRMGQAGRERVVRQWSVEQMVSGYEQLIERLYRQRTHSEA